MALAAAKIAATFKDRPLQFCIGDRLGEQQKEQHQVSAFGVAILVFGVWEVTSIVIIDDTYRVVIKDDGVFPKDKNTFQSGALKL